MELVPILSTIILVATIMTFILAIGAYVLYKVRERRGERVMMQQPAKITAEVITPAEYQEEAPLQQPVFIEQPLAVGYQTMQRQPMYQQQQVQVPQPPAPPRPVQPVYNPQPRPYSQEQQVEQPRQQVRAGQNQPVENKQDSKFLKYTSEGYVPAKEDKNLGALKWK